MSKFRNNNARIGVNEDHVVGTRCGYQRIRVRDCTKSTDDIFPRINTINVESADHRIADRIKNLDIIRNVIRDVKQTVQ